MRQTWLEKLQDNLVEGIVIAIMSLVVLAFAYCGYQRATCPKRKVIVELIGGCDKYGDCGVKYTNGAFGEEHMPIVGQEFEVCK